MRTLALIIGMAGLLQLALAAAPVIKESAGILQLPTTAVIPYGPRCVRMRAAMATLDVQQGAQSARARAKQQRHIARRASRRVTASGCVS